MRTFPVDYDANNAVFISVPKSMVPIVSGLLAELERPGAWASDADYELGYQFAACMQEALAMDCQGRALAEIGVLLAHMSGLTDNATAGEVYQFLPAIGGMLESIDDNNLDPNGHLYQSVARIASQEQQQTNTAINAELGAIIAAALGYPPSAGAAIGAALPQLGGFLDNIFQSGHNLDGVFKLPMEQVVVALRGTTAEPDEDALLDQIKDFWKG